MLIIDTRAKEAFDQGHIKGAESWPEAEIAARVVKLPKDKLIVAYCACSADSGAVRVAQQLHDTYKFDYANLKVLLGGWGTWQQENTKDANAYPIESASGTTP